MVARSGDASIAADRTCRPFRENPMHLELVVVLLFAIATGVALVARWLKLPYTAALVVAGLIIGAGNWVPAPHLSKDLLFAVFLPGLLFEAAFHLDAKQFWANKFAICGLAVPGVIAAICVTAFILSPVVQGLHLEQGFKLIDGLVFGGIVAATDPIAVVALFKSLGTPKRLGVLVEGESLLNDGTAVVLFGVILSLASGAPVTAASVVTDFVRTCGLGILIGAALGYGGSKIIHWVDDPMIEITATVVVAWGSFALAEEAHASGVLATVSAGLLCGNYGARTGMSPTTKIAVVSFWAYLAFALNSMVFLLIGFEVELGQVLAAWRTVLLAWLATTAARVVVVAGVTLLLRRSRERLPRWWGAVMSWGGIRGGLSMVLVLALPLAFPHRQFLVNVVFGVVVVSILVQGSTMAPLLKRLGIVSEHAATARYQLARADALAAGAGLDELNALANSHVLEPALVQELRAEYEARVADASARTRALHVADSILADEERRSVRRRLVIVEKERVLRAIHEGLSTEDAAAELIASLDARLVQLSDSEDA
jgi:CPA1 family monovalent cation:H+ antiporter